MKTILACTLFLLSLPLKAQYQVIVHPDTPVDHIDVETLRAIYLGRITRWPNQQRIRMAFLQQSKVSEPFYQHVLKKTRYQYRNLWNQAVFTGIGRPPEWFQSVPQLLEYVRKQKGAIGFLPDTEVAEGVKVLRLDIAGHGVAPK